MISEETDKGNDLSANNIIPQGQNILCAFSCANSYGFVDGKHSFIRSHKKYRIAASTG